jgi:hypothetical protein
MAGKVSILDLPVRALRDIEVATGARMSEWPAGVDSLADLYARIYSAGTGTPLDEVEAMSLRELASLVTIAESEDADPDPT